MDAARMRREGCVDAAWMPRGCHADAAEMPRGRGVDACVELPVRRVDAAGVPRGGRMDAERMPRGCSVGAAWIARAPRTPSSATCAGGLGAYLPGILCTTSGIGLRAGYTRPPCLGPRPMRLCPRPIPEVHGTECSSRGPRVLPAWVALAAAAGRLPTLEAPQPGGYVSSGVGTVAWGWFRSGLPDWPGRTRLGATEPGPGADAPPGGTATRGDGRLSAQLRGGCVDAACMLRAGFVRAHGCSIDAAGMLRGCEGVRALCALSAGYPGLQHHLKTCGGRWHQASTALRSRSRSAAGSTWHVAAAGPSDGIQGSRNDPIKCPRIPLFVHLHDYSSVVQLLNLV